MGHVLVGASQCLSPLMHQDALDAVAQLETAAAIAQANSTYSLARSCRRA